VVDTKVGLKESNATGSILDAIFDAPNMVLAMKSL